MEKLTFTIDINAPRNKVWSIMLDKPTYEQWTKTFHEGSTYEGNWEEGSEIKFIGPTDTGDIAGMYAVIAKNRPFEYISIRHLGEFKEGKKIPWPMVAEGESGYENYSFKDTPQGTKLSIDLNIPAEWKDMFNDMWPKALVTLKTLAEK